jgi:integrase
MTQRCRKWLKAKSGSIAHRLPIILSQEEAVRLIDSASNLFHRATLMTLYSTGMRRAEMCQLKVEDIDSERMVVHIRHGKRKGEIRSVPLSFLSSRAGQVTGSSGQYECRGVHPASPKLYAGNVVRRLSSTGPPTVKW